MSLVSLVRLVDTDVVIDVLRGRSPLARQRFESWGEVATSAVSVHEIVYGAHRSHDPSTNLGAVEAFVALVTVVDLDREAARHAGEIRAELAAAGTPIGAYDLLIAGTARSRGMVLVTRNERKFSRVPGLRLEPWIAAD